MLLHCSVDAAFHETSSATLSVCTQSLIEEYARIYTSYLNQSGKQSHSSCSQLPRTLSSTISTSKQIHSSPLGNLLT